MVNDQFVGWFHELLFNKSKIFLLKLIYSEKATKFCEIFTLLLSYVVPVKSKVEISQNFVAFSEYMNFINTDASDICTTVHNNCILDNI